MLTHWKYAAYSKGRAIRDSALLAIQLTLLGSLAALLLAGNGIDISPHLTISVPSSLKLAASENGLTVDDEFRVVIETSDLSGGTLEASVKLVTWEITETFAFSKEYVEALEFSQVTSTRVESASPRYYVDLHGSQAVPSSVIDTLDKFQGAETIELGHVGICLELALDDGTAEKEIRVPVVYRRAPDVDAPDILGVRPIEDCSEAAQIEFVVIAEDNRTASEALHYRAVLSGEVEKSFGWLNSNPEFDNLPNGSYDITIVAKDEVGFHSEPWIGSFVVDCPDIVAPGLSLLDFTLTKTFAGGVLRIELSATDNRTPPDRITFHIQIDTETTVTTDRVLHLPLLGGEYDISIHAEDLAGNVGQTIKKSITVEGFERGIYGGLASTANLDTGLWMRGYSETPWGYDLVATVTFFTLPLAPYPCVLACIHSDLLMLADWRARLGIGAYWLPQDAWVCLTVSPMIEVSFPFGAGEIVADLEAHVAFHERMLEKHSLIVLLRIGYRP